MKKTILSILIILIFGLVSRAEFEFVETSIVNMALSGSGIAYIKDVGVLISNPAAISYLEKGQFYAVSKEEFSIDEMESNFISLGNKMSNYFNFAFSNLDFGYTDYRENTYIITLATKMYDNSSIGFNIKKLNSRILNTDNNSAFSFDIAFSGIVSNTEYVLSIQNANVPTVNDEIPRSYELGFNFNTSSKNSTLLSFYKVSSFGNQKKDLSMRIGQVWQTGDNLKIYAGFATKPYKLSGGFSLDLSKKWTLDYAFSSMKYLNPTHAVAFKMNLRGIDE
ncbi:MAG: hypothetical protein M0P94_05080 [Candidatus Absconditabacterales bacterium]|nr:hypothetical protein [Candidatus Absconditabacterales bacterium]